MNSPSTDNPAAELQRIVDESKEGEATEDTGLIVVRHDKLMQALVMREVARDARVRAWAYDEGFKLGKIQGGLNALTQLKADYYRGETDVNGHTLTLLEMLDRRTKPIKLDKPRTTDV